MIEINLHSISLNGYFKHHALFLPVLAVYSAEYAVSFSGLQLSHESLCSMVYTKDRRCTRAGKTSGC